MNVNDYYLEAFKAIQAYELKHCRRPETLYVNIQDWHQLTRLRSSETPRVVIKPAPHLVVGTLFGIPAAIANDLPRGQFRVAGIPVGHAQLTATTLAWL